MKAERREVPPYGRQPSRSTISRIGAHPAGRPWRAHRPAAPRSRTSDAGWSRCCPGSTGNRRTTSGSRHDASANGHGGEQRRGVHTRRAHTFTTERPPSTLVRRRLCTIPLTGARHQQLQQGATTLLEPTRGRCQSSVPGGAFDHNGVSFPGWCGRWLAIQRLLASLVPGMANAFHATSSSPAWCSCGALPRLKQRPTKRSWTSLYIIDTPPATAWTSLCLKAGWQTLATFYDCTFRI